MNNRELCAAFRELMTQRFYVIDADGVVLEGAELDEALLATKPWRGELWKAFRELEDRLCPYDKFKRTGVA